MFKYSDYIKLCDFIQIKFGKLFETFEYSNENFNSKKLKINKIFRTKWFTNRNFRGSYTYNSVTAYKLNASRLDLQEPLKNSAGQDVVLFAGEATNQHRYSTVHGAIETGWREASRLLRQQRTNVAPKLLCYQNYRAIIGIIFLNIVYTILY